ncbi:MAG: hypothetical protein IMX00_00840 [Limnochordales bacterium]|nr:hypothetical protein [Limnochordales bacterium]
MEIRAIAPNRIDLAGGTLDLYPLYLFEDGGYTVNAAISVWSKVLLRTREDGAVHIYSLDTGAEQHSASIDELALGGPLDLIARVIRYYRPGVGLDVYTQNEAPKGSGLGASSALLIALSHALRVLKSGSDRLADEEIIRVGAELEAQTIRVPTGKQDYYAATYGGVNSIWFSVGESRVERLLMRESDLAALESRLILSYTGEPHYSAITNWGMLKGYIEGQDRTVNGLRRIKETARRMRECLLAGAGAGAQAHSFPAAASDSAPALGGSVAGAGEAVAAAEAFPGLAELIAEEWRNRRELADGVTTPNVDRLMDAAAAAGAKASKLCGAGGGGCMITVIGDDSDTPAAWPDGSASAAAARSGDLSAVRARVEAALTAAGARIMPFKIARTGVRVEVRADDVDGLTWLATDPVDSASSSVQPSVG